MRKTIVWTLCIVVASIVVTILWVDTNPYQCIYPINFTVQKIDPRFNLSISKAESELQQASSAWENASGKDYFTEDIQPPTVFVNVYFVYDDRQKILQEQKQLEKDVLNFNEELAIYEQNIKNHNSAVLNYNKELEAYEKRVSEWNTLPDSKRTDAVFNELKAEQKRLNKLEIEIDTNTYLYDQMRIKIEEKRNNLSTREEDLLQKTGSTTTVGEYYSENQSLYIYRFANTENLRQTLVHEIGHTLGLDHSDNFKSIMHSKITPDQVITKEDLAKLPEICN